MGSRFANFDSPRRHRDTEDKEISRWGAPSSRTHEEALDQRGNLTLFCGGH
jgi:hypothetical protein